MLILDTDVVTLLQGGHPGVVRNLEAARLTQAVATTIITFVEVLRGRFEFLLKANGREQFLKAQALLRHSEERLRELPTLELDDESLDAFDQLLRSRYAS